MMLKVRPSPDPDLPQLPRSPFLHAVLTTPVDRTGACRFLSLPARPSPVNWRVGVHIQTFEASSSFTRVTACKIAARPRRTFVPRLRPSQLPGQAARELPCLPTTTWVGPPPTGELR